MNLSRRSTTARATSTSASSSIVAHRNLRVFDYRVGNYQQKRDFFDRIASEPKGLRKVFTVVEKQDSKSWRSVGFSREGAIPGYFRTADAYIMSRVYTEDGDPIQGGAPKLHGPTIQSGFVGRRRRPSPARLSIEIVTDAEPAQGRQRRAWPRPIVLRPVPPRACSIPISALHGRRSASASTGSERRPTARSATRRSTCSASPSKTTTSRSSSSASSPCSKSSGKWTRRASSGLAPVDAPLCNQVYSDLGFKVTARLTDHVTREEDFVGVQLWHKRLMNQSAPRLPSFI